jgi:predicted GNAT family acetyltransferase
MSEPLVEHDAARGRFHTVVDGLAGVCDYRLAGGVMQIVHTEVDPALQGRGVAAALVAAALAHAQAEGLRVLPLCSYVRSYMRRHPQTLELLARQLP